MVQTMFQKEEDRLAPENFCFWLQGFIEMSGATSINEEQMKVLKEHLELVFKKVATQQVQPQFSFPATPGITVPGTGWGEVTFAPNPPYTVIC